MRFCSIFGNLCTAGYTRFMKLLKIAVGVVLCFFVVLFVFYTTASDDEDVLPSASFQEEYDYEVAALLSNMTLAEKVGQMMMLGVKVDKPISDSLLGRVKEMVDDYHIGGIILSGSHIYDRDRVVDFVKQVQAWSPIPLFIAVDQEGVFVRLDFLKEQTPQFKVKDLVSAERVAFDRARELRAIGVTMNFSPVIEYVPSAQGFMWSRSFQSDPQTIGLLGDAMVRGYQLGGVIPVIKHFPGHGNSGQDSHDHHVVLDISREDADLYLRPFKDVIARNPVVPVMVGHVTIPSIDDEMASCSPIFISDILRKSFHHQGVIIVDALDMSICGPQEVAAVRAISAGADIVFPAGYPGPVPEYVVSSVVNGTISEEQIDASVARILALKQKMFGGVMVRDDHKYEITVDDAQVFEVQVDGDGFLYPDSAPIEDVTAILEVVVVSDGASPDTSSHITFLSEDHVYSQYFFSDVLGRRYLNVSHVVGHGQVQMVGQGVGWSHGRARLIVFRNPIINSSTRTLILSTHPDDAEIAAFGLYFSTDSDVVTVTAGDAGHKNYGTLLRDNGEHYRVKGQMRVLDSLSVPLSFGVSSDRVRNLGYFDGTLHSLYKSRDREGVVLPLFADLDDMQHFRRFNIDKNLSQRPFRSTWSHLVDDIYREIKRVNPSVIVAPNPLLDTHSDHQYTTIALVEALEKSTWDGLLLLYTNHPQHEEGYPLGPSAAIESLTPWFGSALPFSSIFSYSVDERVRRLNILALEAMHDLRSFCYGYDDSYSEECAARVSDYMRRGPRPNKMYLVLTVQDVLRLRDLFLWRK